MGLPETSNNYIKPYEAFMVKSFISCVSDYILFFLSKHALFLSKIPNYPYQGQRMQFVGP